MDKLKLKLGEKRTLELTSGTTVVVKMDGGDCDGEPMYDVKLLGCSWAEIVALGRALAPEGISARDFEQAVREVEVVEPEEEGAS
jgi:hypothetical protein